MKQKKIDTSIYISASQINSFNNCEAKWFFNKIMRLKIIPSGAMTLGKAFDDSLTYNFAQKIKTKLDIKVDVLIDVFDTSFNQSKDDTNFAGDTKDNVKQVGRNLVRAYMSKVAPQIQPAEVQKAYETHFDNVDWVFIAKPDLITVRGVLIDNKTVSKSPPLTPAGYWIKPDDLMQMQSYDISVNEQESQKIKRSLLIYAVKKASPDIITVEVPHLTNSDIKYFRTMTALIYQRMRLIRDNEIPPKPNRLSNNCSRKWCGFWNECEKMFGGKVKE